MDHTTSRHESGPPAFWGSRYSIGFLVLGAIAAYFLLSEHRAHFIGSLPWLLLLACPLMHVFMHDGHADHEAPILLIMYARLAVAEEAQMREQFGAEFETYAACRR